MNKSWSFLIIAGFFEVMWVIGLKYANSIFEWFLTVVAIFVSFGLLIYSGKKLPTSTAYAVFVGLGTVGTVVCEMAWFHAPFNLLKLTLIALLLVGIMGLKLVTNEHPGNEQEEGERS